MVYADGIEKRQHYERLYAKLHTDRSSFDNHYRELSAFIRPRRTRFITTDRNKGDKRNKNIIDGAATMAARTLQSGMHAGISSPARPWLKLTLQDKKLANRGAVKTWLHDVTEILLASFAVTNLYNGLPTLYGDMGTFATGAMAMLEDVRDPFRCYSYPIGSYWLGMSNRGEVDTFIRKYQYTIRQAVDEFGLDTVSPNIKRLYDKGEYEETFDVTWVVAPNVDHDPEKLHSKYKAWSSCIYEDGANSGEFLREAGYDEFPVIAPRWDVTGEDTYGTDCPGMTALGDVKQLQTMVRKKSQAVEKLVNPPLQVPNALKNQKVTLVAGDTNYFDETQGNRGIRSVHEVNLNIDHLRVDCQDVRNLVQRAYYEDLWLMLAVSDDSPQKTAREIDERHEEKLLALGPMLERVHDEGLNKVVDRAYAMADRRGEIPPPPEEIMGSNLQVEFISILSQAQKLVGVSSADRFVSNAIAMIQVFPEIKHKLNTFAIIDFYVDALGVPPDFVLPDDEAAESMQAEQQAIAQQQQAEQAAQVAGAAKDLGDTSTNPDAALGQLIQAAGG